MKDTHNLGTFETLERVWDLYPYGGCPGDYITIAGVIIYWNDDRRVWGNSGDHVSTTEDQHVEGGLIVDGDLTIGGSTKGKSASFTMLKVESLEVENPPYAEKIHDHDDVYAKKGDIPSVDGYATQEWVERKGYLTNLDLNGYATEDWVESKISSSAPSLPIASSSILGGVKIGKNISINKDGVISADNVYELTKDKILSVLRDENGLISLDANLALSGGLVNYANLGNVDLPSIYDGIPIDGTTIGRDSSGALTVLGGVGSDFDATQMWASLSGSGAEQINKSHLTDALAGYARTSDIPSLSGYATESWVNDKGYVTTNRLNELIGGASSAFDTLKEIEDYINSHESVTAGLIASLGNKVDKVIGMGLSEHSFTTSLRDKLNSIAEGANKYILPVAKAAVLGGVMIGSNINVNAQGVISVEAPYSHPTQQVITVGAARHFLTGLAVNEYGHVTSATSAALTKDDLLSVLKDEDGVIRLDAQLALTGSLINFANLGTVNIPSLYDGIPVDGKSIYWENGTLKSSSTGGGGLAKVIVKVGLAAYESVDGVVTLPAYPTMPDLTNYVTLNTDQNINGYKSFRDKITIYNSALAPYNGFELQGTSTIAPNMTFHFPGKHANMLFMDYASRLNWDGLAVYAKAFAIENGTANQVLRADGGVETFEYSGQHGQPDWVWGAISQFEHRVWNPANFRVANANTVGDVGVGNLAYGYNERNHASQNDYYTGDSYVLNYMPVARAAFFERGGWSYASNGYVQTDFGNIHLAGTAIATFGGLPNITSLYITPLNAAVSNPLVGEMLFYTANGEGYSKGWTRVLSSRNWQSIVDGRYLLINGGTLTGALTVNNQVYTNSWFRNTISGQGLYNEAEQAHWYAQEGYWNATKQIRVGDNLVWNAGNDGTGSGLDSDMLDGFHETSFFREGIGSYSVADVESTTANIGRRTGSYQISHDGYSSSLLSFNIGGSAAWFQLWKTSYGNGGELRYRTSVDQELSQPWKTLIDEGNIQYVNAGSATKLQTARLIYGQNFDGTTNISGALSDVRSITSLINLPIDYVSQQGQYFYTNNNKATPLLSLTGNVGIGTASPIKTFEVWGSSLFNLSNRNTTTVGSFGAGNCLSLQSSNHEKYGLYGWITGSGDFHWQSGRDDGNSSMYNILFQEYGGNICFGNTEAISKVNVYGSIRATDAVYGGRIFAGFDAGVPNSMSCSDWFRSSGPTGWFNQTYSGGMYMADSDQVRVYNNKVLYNDGFRVWGIDGHHVGLKLYNQHHIGINLANAAYTWGIYAHNNGNMYIGRRNGDVNDISGSYYLIIGAGTMTYNGSIVLNGGGLITYSSDIRLKEIQEYFKPSLSELAALPIFAHSWRNGTPGVQLSTSAQAVQKIMPWNVFEGDDGYLKMDGTRTALAVSIRLAQLANEYITNNERWKSDKDRQIEALQREVRKLKQKLNAA